MQHFRRLVIGDRKRNWDIHCVQDMFQQEGFNFMGARTGPRNSLHAVPIN